MNLTSELKKQLMIAQQNELTEAIIYQKLAGSLKDQHNKAILERIASEEHAHYLKWKHYTHEDVKPKRLKIFFFYWISRILGITFGLKLMEKGEEGANINYTNLSKEIPFAQEIAKEEEEHEKELLQLIDEEKLNYAGSMVLGLNDALVEMTGALAGFTLAIQNNRVIALIGLITGISATLSMAASEYLSTKTEEAEDTNAGKAALYTGIAYIITVVLLVLPYFVLSNPLLSLVWMLITVLLIIFVFNFYISVAKDLNFKRRFFEMAFVSMGVATLSFVIGLLVNQFFGISV